MKKIIGTLGIGMVVLTLFFNMSSIKNDIEDSNVNLMSLLELNSAAAECSENGTSIDCFTNTVRGGTLTAVACSITVWGTEYCCLTVLDATLESNGLKTCKQA